MADINKSKIKNFIIYKFGLLFLLGFFSCGINPPEYDFGYDFIQNFNNAIIDQQDKNVRLEKSWDIFGEKRKAIITIANPAGNPKITFLIPANRSGNKLYFGVGMNSEIGDGAVGKIIVSSENRDDNIYRRYLNPSENLYDRMWVDEVVDLSYYEGNPIKITFTVDQGSKGDFDADWFAWSTPIISNSY